MPANSGRLKGQGETITKGYPVGGSLLSFGLEYERSSTSVLQESRATTNREMAMPARSVGHVVNNGPLKDQGETAITVVHS